MTIWWVPYIFLKVDEKTKFLNHMQKRGLNRAFRSGFHKETCKWLQKGNRFMQTNWTEKVPGWNKLQVTRARRWLLYFLGLHLQFFFLSLFFPSPRSNWMGNGARALFSGPCFSLWFIFWSLFCHRIVKGKTITMFNLSREVLQTEPVRFSERSASGFWPGRVKVHMNLCEPKVCSANRKLIFDFIFGSASSDGEATGDVQEDFGGNPVALEWQSGLGEEERLYLGLLCKADQCGRDW